MRGSTVDPSNPSKRNQIILWANGWEQCVGSLELIREADPEFHKKIRVATMYERQGTTRETREAVEQQEQEMREYAVVSCISPWERQKMRWAALYEQLGKNPSRRSKDLEEKRAATWQCSQRMAKKKGSLSEERVKELEAISGWEWETDTWDEQLQHWVTVYSRIQKEPSTMSKDLEEKRAGQWQGNQRTAKKNETMSEERITKLEAIPGWEWDADTWDEQLQHWITVYTRIQRVPSQSSRDPEDKRAGHWQSYQRKVYSKGIMSEERITKLEAIPGWEWETDTWDEQLQHWITVYTMIQRVPSQKSKEKEEARAGSWQSHQRTAKKNETMSEERITKLEAIPGWEWDADTWDEQLQHWVTVYTRIQRAPSKNSKDLEEKRTGQWQSHQRVAKNKRILSDERIAELEAVPGWEWGTEREETYSWDEQLQHWVIVYTRIQKDPSQISKDLEEKRAGRWLSHQRVAKKKGKMLPERVAKLEAIPGWTWSAK
jgi:hypothetical protein